MMPGQLGPANSSAPISAFGAGDGIMTGNSQVWPKAGAGYGQNPTDPLTMLIALLQGFAFQSGLNGGAQSQAPFGAGGVTGAGGTGFGGSGTGGTSGGTSGGISGPGTGEFGRI